MAEPDLTVLFATRNGESVLPRTLEAYCRADNPPCGWKLVVIDNGSTDSTPVILRSFKNRLPLEIFSYPTAGQNRARNFGLHALEGRLAILPDDDAIPDPFFLCAWAKYLNERLDYELLGGTIDLFFDVPPPKWVLANKVHFALQYSLRNLPEGPIEADQIFGPNMAVRRSVFDNGFRFDETMGPDGWDPIYPMGGETEFLRRVGRSGAKSWFARSPRVEHIIRCNHLSRSYWAKRFYRHGRGVARQTWEANRAPPSYILRPRIIDRAWRLHHKIRMFSPSSTQSIESLQAFYWKQGFADEWSRRVVNSANETRPDSLRVVAPTEIQNLDSKPCPHRERSDLFYSADRADAALGTMTKHVTELAMILANWIVYVTHPRMIRHFHRSMGYWPDVCRPRTKNEKFLWRKVFDRNPMYRLVSDKLAVRAFVKSRCPDLALADIAWIGSSLDQAPCIEAGSIIKTNNGSSRNIIVGDGPSDRGELSKQIAEWLTRPYGIAEGEWNYRDIQPYVFVEKSVSTPGDPSFLEISCHVLMGKCAFVTVEKDVKKASERIAAYDARGNRLIISLENVLPDSFQLPATFEQAIRDGERIAKEFDYVRVDFMSVGSKLYFCECTVMPRSGLSVIGREADDLINAAWDLRKSWFMENPQSGLKGLYSRLYEFWRSDCDGGGVRLSPES
jgi:glucosyl-dolichyl phosphate glucuronosyltransferase